MNITEPGIVTQDDFKQVYEEGRIRSLVTPMRYHAGTIGSVVMSSAFDQLRDAYLSAIQITYVGVCTLCKGEVNTAQQFIRTGTVWPSVTHMVCEERAQFPSDLRFSEYKIRYQARVIESQQDQILKLETALSNVRTALSNFGNTIMVKITGEDTHAISEGEKQRSYLEEHPYRGGSRETTEAGSSDSVVEGGKVSSEVFAAEQESTRALALPLVHEYKWPPEFRQYVAPEESASNNCHLDPLGCPDEETSAEKYALYGPNYSIATEAKCIGSSCE